MEIEKAAAEKKHRVLIVDDERFNINVLGSMLAEKYEINVALEGGQALKRALSHPRPDLILLDIRMPGMNGYEVCENLKKNPQTKDIPVIFITAMTDEQDEKKGLELGAVDYIAKPFRPSIVMARIKNHLELKRHRDLLDQLSSLDGLTGIPNRRKFDEFLDYEWHRALRTGLPLSLGLLDIDYFKNFNDRYGHVAGDDCLKKVGKTLENSLKRTTDLAARYGGEEFACVLPETDLQGAMYIARELHAKINALAIPHELSVAAPHITVSMGVTTQIPSPSDSPAALIKEADKRLYQAKEAGRNRVTGE
ncbi:MAG: diguanylate cyclase [Gammaproteobacteria bacterium]|nr:diguanylate cyclase [Gammaproteobacteria bacterium]